VQRPATAAAKRDDVTLQRRITPRLLAARRRECSIRAGQGRSRWLRL